MTKHKTPLYKRSVVVMRFVVLGLQTTVLLFQAKALVLPNPAQPCKFQPVLEQLG